MNPALRALAGLIVGLAGGALAARAGGPSDGLVHVAEVVGGLWLDALRMTVLPLVVTLVATGVARAARTSGDRVLLRRTGGWFVGLLVVSAVVALVAGPPLLALWRPDPTALAALRTGLAPPAPPPAADAWLRGLVPANLVATAAAGGVAPLALFAAVFGLAAARLPAERTATLLAALGETADVILVIVRWVLVAAPVGVAALAFGVGVKLGLGAGALLAHYVGVQIAVTLALAAGMYALTAAGGSVGGFARAAVEPQVVAASTQSSLAALPPMLTAAARCGVAPDRAGVVLPLAVALFRLAAPASIVIVTLTLARLTGVALAPPALAVVGGLAVLGTLVIAGLPNQATFLAAYAPPALAVGVPIELLPLFLAVDVIPDVFYTLTNVTADLAVAVRVGGVASPDTERPAS